MTTRAIELNLHVTLPPAWAALAREQARALAPFGSTVDLETCAPHVTIYLASWPEEAVTSVCAALGSLAREAGPVTSRITGTRAPGRGYVFLEVERTPSLARLHALALERLSPLRRGFVADDILELAETLPARERALAHEDGFPWVRELFAPHVTLAKVPTAREAEAARLVRAALPPAEIGRFPALALGASGRHGTVVTTLETVLLPTVA